MMINYILILDSTCFKIYDNLNQYWLSPYVIIGVSMTENLTLNPSDEPVAQTETARTKTSGARIWLFVVIALVLLGLLVFGIFLLATAPEGTTSRVRDIFIIFMALESLVLGVGLIILIVQLATLINLLQNEIKPILDSTNETVSTLKGTTKFLSDNMVEPIMKLNEYLAGLKKFFEIIRPDRR
jgi:hypothetical protein